MVVQGSEGLMPYTTRNIRWFRWLHDSFGEWALTEMQATIGDPPRRCRSGLGSDGKMRASREPLESVLRIHDRRVILNLL